MQGENDTNEDFHVRLSRLISSSQSKQKDISLHTEISPSALAKYKVDRIPKAWELLKIANYFNVSMEWLLNGSEVKPEKGKLESFSSVQMNEEEVERQETDTNEDVQLDQLKTAKLKASSVIPVISWAHAGEAESYEELPESWQEHITADIGDDDGFAVRLRGDSMEPRYYEGDVLLISPTRRPYNGSLVVCKFKSDGIIFRQIEVIDKTIRLVPINARYPATEHDEDDFHWIYLVVEMRRNILK